VKARAPKLLQHRVEPAVVLEHQQQRPLGIKHPAGPDGQLARGAQVQRALDVAAAEGELVARVHELHVLGVARPLKALHGQGPHALQRWRRIAAGVGLLQTRVVAGLRGQAVQRQAHEGLFVARLQQRVVLPLMPNGGAVALA
jgi:hypothetical protein